MKKQVALSPGTQAFKTLLEARGLPSRIREFPESTHTAQQAADALGCQIGQIAKSIVFRSKTSKEVVFVLVSGPNRVDQKMIQKIIGQKVETAPPDFVKEKTGYEVGSVSPLGFSTPIAHVFIDQDLLQFEEIWAAAGTDNSVFALDTKAIATLLPTGKVIAIH